MKITKIGIKHFRAFRGEYVIDLHGGHNLLVYGENGSGKSSLYQALDLFFAPGTPYDVHKNIFAGTDDGFVRLEIGDGTNPSQTYEWEETTHPFTQPLIVQTAKTKGFLDYGALMETHYAHRRADAVNVFDLLVTSLLANVQNPISQRIFAVEWDSIQQLLTRRRGRQRDQHLNLQLTEFNLGLTSLLANLTAQANAILATFEQECTIQLSLPPGGLQLTSNTKAIDQPSILLMVDYYQRRIPRHHHFLNEARLSAIAISIYLGALLLSPPSQLRILFLDDILIGLDMSNRLPLLDVLAQHFPDWQIMMTTFDRVWFEMIRERVKQASEWELAEIFCGRTDEGDLPVFQQSKDYLRTAKQHLDNNDLRAAAVYIRSAYERAVERFCDKCDLLVRYCGSVKDQKSDDFWRVVKTQKLTSGVDMLEPALINDIELYRSTILNQLTHMHPVNLVRLDVQAAYKAVERLQNTLRAVNKRDLQ